tara:strand:+ start:17179 stop:17556 length:378 start_codon:yes stop_codon:yes gene_type:complete
MATSQTVTLISGLVGSAITVYRLVTLAADGSYDHTGADGAPDGVAAETVATVGGAVPIALPTGAVVKIECGGTVTAGGVLESMAGGKVQNYAGGLNSNRVGKALEAGVDGQIISVLFSVDLDQVA